MSRSRNAIVWACAIALAVVFGLTGISKLTGASSARWAERFALWGYPAGTQYLVGLAEILGAAGVLLGRSRRIAALMLIVIMAGAALTHMIHAELPRVIPPLVLGAVALLMLLACTTRRQP